MYFAYLLIENSVFLKIGLCEKFALHISVEPWKFMFLKMECAKKRALLNIAGPLKDMKL